jgi:sec-independent protein translocase protein TatC
MSVAYWQELQTRLRICAVVWLLFSIPLVLQANKIFIWFIHPLTAILPNGHQLVVTQVASSFTVPLKLALYLGCFLTLPVVLFHTWRFIAPALFNRERKMILAILFGSLTLLCLGFLFAHKVILPTALGFFISQTPDQVSMMLDINAYLDFAFTVLMGTGIGFQIPLAVLMVTHLNIISIEALQKARPYVVTIIFIIGMLLTPPDVISQSLLSIPMWLLFEAGILLARCTEQRLSTSNQEIH